MNNLGSSASSLDDRLENWAIAWRRRARANSTPSLEGSWRSPQIWYLPPAPNNNRVVDWLDAQEIELAVCSIDPFHHCIIKGWYVLRTYRKWSPQWVLYIARKAASDRNPRARGDLEASLAMAKALVAASLDSPAVVRRERARSKVAQLLGMPANLSTAD